MDANRLSISLRKVVILSAVVLFFAACVMAGGREIDRTDSPDGRYQYYYKLTGKEIKDIKNFQSYDYEEYELHLVEKRTKKDKVLLGSMFWVRDVSWSPDSKWLIISNYTRHNSSVYFLSIKDGKTKGVDFFGFAQKHQQEYGLDLSEGLEFHEIKLIEFSDDNKTIEMSYSFGYEGSKQTGKIVYDFQKFEIIKLIPDVLEEEESE